MRSVPSTFISHFKKCWWSKTWSKDGHDQGESCLQKQLSNPQKEMEINTRFQYLTHKFKICKWIHLLETLLGIQHNIQKQKNEGMALVLLKGSKWKTRPTFLFSKTSIIPPIQTRADKRSQESNNSTTPVLWTPPGTHKNENTAGALQKSVKQETEFMWILIRKSKFLWLRKHLFSYEMSHFPKKKKKIPWENFFRKDWLFQAHR